MYPIPANATRIRYLYNNPTGGTTTASHSSGAAIDTGIIPTSNLVVSLRVMFLSQNTWGSVFGVESSDGNADGYRLHRDNRNNFVVLNIGAYSSRVQNNGYVENAVLDIECENKYITINGSKTTGTYSEESPQSNTLVVGCCRRNGNLIDYSNMRIYALKLYDGNSLVFDGVPVRVGDTGELFDRVTGTYATRSGTFVCGPDTFQQGVVPTRMMAMGACRKSAPPLPYDSEVEWLSGNSGRTAYVQTDIIPTAETIVDFTASFSGASAGWWFATEDSYHNTTATNTAGQGFSFGWNNEPFRLVYAGGFTKITSGVFVQDSAMSFHLEGGVLSSGGTTLANRAAATLTASTWIALLANNRGNTIIEKANTGYRLHSFKTTVSGVVTHDLIAVRIGTDGYFYDRANPTGGPNGNGLYGNAGTGSFTLGPDK